MSEQVPPQPRDDVEPDLGEGPPEPAYELDEPARTGVPAVDEVLADVDRLDDVPLDQHLSAYERAHDSLRSALDADPGEPA